jgi:hypothetical protein
VTDSGIKYLGPNADDSYQKAGPDGLLGTEDDVYVWKIDENEEIGPCNETETHGTIQVRNVSVTPPNAEVMKGGSVQFKAKVLMSDGSTDPAGVTWSVEPSGSAAIDSNGLLTVNANASAKTLTVTAASVTNPFVTHSVTVTVKSGMNAVPEIAGGNTLLGAKIGDDSDWVEIATNGDYSLIVRKNYINTRDDAANYGKPDWQYIKFGPNNRYAGSDVQAKINNWFRGTAGKDADNLPTDAPLRSYTMTNTALDEIGSGPVIKGKEDGFSKPREISDGYGYDIAFALSYGEAANFVSKSYAWGGGTSAPSSQAAQNNFGEITIPTENNSYNRFWLRSPGNSDEKASHVFHTGNVFQGVISGTNRESGLVYPALWVKSEIFLL